MANTREIALDILLSIDKDKGFSNITLNKMIPDKMENRDSNLVRELVYGVIENKLYIDNIIKKASKIRIKKIHPAIMSILRLGIYQIVFMDNIPSSAAVNESVKLAKKKGNRGSISFVNGVLRNISRDPNKFTQLNRDKPIEYLSIKYSHPEYLVKKWLNEFGYEFTEELLKANNKTPSLNIRVNTLKISRNDLKIKLKKRGFECLNGDLSKDALKVLNPYKITDTADFKEGLFTIQDESSILVGQVLNPWEGSLILDMCSAPGGKATHIGQLMNNSGRIIARDIHKHKIKLIEDNASRLGVDIIESQLYDALKLDNDLIGKVDYTLIDAPCSGLGLIRRKPEIKWNRKEEDIDELVSLQGNILNIGKNYVKNNGILLYSTCTIYHEENLNMINRFLDRNRKFKLEAITEINERLDFYNTLSKGYIQLYPNIHKTDGFFIAKMRKEG